MQAELDRYVAEARGPEKFLQKEFQRAQRDYKHDFKSNHD